MVNALWKGKKKSTKHGRLRTPAGLAGVGVVEDLEDEKAQSCQNGGDENQKNKPEQGTFHKVFKIHLVSPWNPAPPDFGQPPILAEAKPQKGSSSI